MPCDPVPMQPITMRSLGATFLPIPKAEDGMICGITNVPATRAAERFTKFLLVDLSAMINNYKYTGKTIMLNSYWCTGYWCFEYHINRSHFNFFRAKFHI